MRTDVFVIGGGPAGLAAAIATRLKGFEVAVADAAHPPIDKACGEGLLPAGLKALRRLGVHIAEGDAFPFRGIRFLGDGVSVEASFSSGFGLAMRRTRLHQILADRAAELGVRLLWNTRVTRTSVELASSRWIIGADGQNSRVRRTAGIEASRESSRYGFRRHYQMSPWTDHVEVYWGSRCQVYVTPVSSDEVGVVVLSRDPHQRLDDALPEFPDLQRKLADAPVSSNERGAVTVSRRLRRVFRGRTVLIGDASGSVDAITGEGLSLSFHQAIALADALHSGDLRAYEEEHRRLARRPALMASLLLSFDRFRWLRWSAVRALAWEPAIFAKLLAMHAPAAP